MLEAAWGVWMPHPFQLLTPQHHQHICTAFAWYTCTSLIRTRKAEQLAHCRTPTITYLEVYLMSDNWNPAVFNISLITAQHLYVSVSGWRMCTHTLRFPMRHHHHLTHTQKRKRLCGRKKSVLGEIKLYCTAIKTYIWICWLKSTTPNQVWSSIFRKKTRT